MNRSLRYYFEFVKKNLMVVLLVCLVFQLHAQAPSEHPWFKAKRINEKVWHIADGNIDNIYLIEGRDSALLIDTGIGGANLPAFIKSLTSLPVIVVNSHSHPDHSGSNY